MSKRKIIYISIAVGSAMALFLSVMGFLPEIFFESADKETPDSTAPFYPSIPKTATEEDLQGEEGKDITQAIEGLYLPTYDKAGNEQMVLRGEHAVLINNRIYKITNPIIDIYYAPDGEATGDPTYITITALNGEMDKATNIGTLYDNVVIKLTEEMNAYTDSLKYEPDKRRIHTDGDINIVGKRIKVTGKGFTADLIEQSVQIKSDVELDIVSTPVAKGPKTSPQQQQRRHTRITSSGPFVYEKRTNTATFPNNARVTSDTLTLLSDNLTLHIDPDNGKLTQLIARGNVLADDAPTTAKTDTLTLDPTSQTVTLEGDPMSELLEGDVSITSSKIILNQKDNKFEVPSEGRLVTKFEMRDEHEPHTTTDPATVKGTQTGITWKGSMSFSKDKNEAVFKNNVEVTKKDSKITCGFLLVNFDTEKSSIKTLKASRTVHLVETKGRLKREAEASQVMWEAGGNLVEMVAEPFAWVQEGNRRITAPYIMFFDNGKKIVGEGQGSFSVTPGSEEDESTNNLVEVDVSWLDRMVLDQAQRKAFFYGGVKTLRGEQKVDSDQLDVFLGDNNKFDKVVAKGNVFFKDLRKGGIEGVGDVANWDCKLGFIILAGDQKAELRRDKARSFSRLISYDLRSQHINWENDTHLQIPFSR